MGGCVEHFVQFTHEITDSGRSMSLGDTPYGNFLKHKTLNRHSVCFCALCEAGNEFKSSKEMKAEMI